MDKTTSAIIDALARDMGKEQSINRLKEEIRRYNKMGNYAQIYKAIIRLNKEGIINIKRIGNSRIPSLNFANYLLTDILAQAEIRKKMELQKTRTRLQPILAELGMRCKDMGFISSISLINAENNIKLNRMEILILFVDQKYPQEYIKKHLMINDILNKISSTYNIKIDYLIIMERDLIDQLKSNKSNIIKSMLSNKITTMSPQSFWIEIKSAIDNGMRIELEPEEIDPSQITEKDLVYNMFQLGYREIGTALEPGKDVSPELIMAALLLGKDVRRFYAIPVIMAKNKINYDILTFLSQKYSKTGYLLGLLKAIKMPSTEMKEAILLMEQMSIKEIKADGKEISRIMELYGAETR